MDSKNMNEPHSFPNHILKKFPYAGRPDQFRRIVKYFNSKGGGNAKQVREQAEIPDGTRRKIEDTWNDLTVEERGFLLVRIGTQMMRASSVTD